jgi:hypothetical protein
MNRIDCGDLTKFRLEQVVRVNQADLLVANFGEVFQNLVVGVAEVGGVDEAETCFGTARDEIVDIATNQKFEELTLAFTRQTENMGMGAFFLS